MGYLALVVVWVPVAGTRPEPDGQTDRRADADAETNGCADRYARSDSKPDFNCL